MHRAAHAAVPAQWFDMVYRSGVVVATGTELTYPLLPETMRIVAGVTGGLARDVFMAGAHSGTSLGVAFGVSAAIARRRAPGARHRRELSLELLSLQHAR
jgi:hypothetical protein